MKYARQFYFLYEENPILTDEDDLEGTIETTARKMLFLAFFLLNVARFVGSQPNGVGGTPENVTVRFIDAKTVKVVWTTVWNNIDRYDVTLKPSDAKVVSLVAGNSKSITLRELQPDTEYQVTITAFVDGKKFKSRPKVFRTKSSNPVTSVVEEYVDPTQTTTTKREPTLPTPEVVNPDPTAIGSKYTPQTSTTVRGVEIGLVSLALVVWIIAIVLFFHRWGKIRMLLPYQPDYKSQQSLKVPGGATMVTSCTGNRGPQGNQEGPGCVQHRGWSSRYFDEPSTEKKSPSRWASRSRVSSAIFPASSSSYYIRTSADCESPEMIRHAHSHNGFSSESIPLCQVNQPKSESPGHVISINVPVISSSVNEKIQTHKRRTNDIITVETKLNNYERLSGGDDNKLKVTGIYHEPKNHKKYLNSLENISDSIHNLLNCVPIYNFCQNKRNSENLDCKRSGNRGEEGEEEPLFFVGEKNLYYKNDDSKNVVHHYHETKLSPEDSEIYENLLPQKTSKKSKRYSRSSLKKQKISLYDEKELDLYKKVPTEKPETPKTKSKTLTPAEIKRKTFLRKVSLQDTYLNYNQDYWLDFEKTGRIHRSIDLGYVCNEGHEKKEEKTPSNKKSSGPKPKMSETISEKSNETESNNGKFPPSKAINPRQSSDLPKKSHKVKYFNRRDSEPLMIRNKKCSCNNCGNKNPEAKTVTEIISEFAKKEQQKSWFILPSNENIPLFYERNGHIETDFDMINDLLDEDCLLVDRAESASPIDDFVINEDDGFCNNDSMDDLQEKNNNNNNNNSKIFDVSDFCEIKLNSDDSDCNVVVVDNVKRSSVFNFQGGQAFFGENRISTSEESDVFLNETEVVGVTFDKKKGFPLPILSVSSPSKSPSPEMS